MIRMEERTIAADGGGMLDIVDMFEPVPDFTPPTQEQIDRMLEVHKMRRNGRGTSGGGGRATRASGGQGRCLACYPGE